VNPTVAVALISGLSTGSLGAFSTYLSWKTGRRASDVELRRIASDDRRLLAAHAEAERQHRQSYYHQLVVHMMRLGSMGGGLMLIDRDLAAEWEAQFWELSATIALFGPDAVTDALDTLEASLNTFNEAASSHAGDRSLSQLSADDWWRCFIDAWMEHHEVVRQATAELTRAMREDVGLLPPAERLMVAPTGQAA
jgi:hypothetical protein